MTLLKREEWQGFVRDVDWTPTYVDDEAIYPEWHCGTGKVPREAWQGWEESYKVSYPEYVATQRERNHPPTRSRPHCSARTHFTTSTRGGSRPPKCISAGSHWSNTLRCSVN